MLGAIARVGRCAAVAASVARGLCYGDLGRGVALVVEIMPERSDVEVLGERSLRLQLVGMMDRAKVEGMLDAIESHVAGEPYFLLLAVIDQMGGVTSEARQVTVERMRLLAPRSIAIVGGSFTQRITTKLGLTAVMVLGRKDRTRGDFFDREDQAEQWLREEDARRDAALAAISSRGARR
ncbi:MAG: STAS/SEC14 domain-containing protein [Myxococcota bacterium]